MKIVQFLIIVLFSFCLVSFSQSQENPDHKSVDELLFFEEYEEIVVITASKKEQKLSDAPATILSISAEQIKKYGWRDLKDVFKTLVGIDVSYDTQGEVRTLVMMRGITGNQKILILQDGERYSTITGERIVYGHNMPLNFYKRIEIIYGPASALYGPEAYAGVVNLITKDGEDVDGLEFGTTYASTEAWIGHTMFGKKIDDHTNIILGGRFYNGNDYSLHDDYEDYEVVNQYSSDLGEAKKIYPIRNWNLLFKLKYNNFLIGGDWQHELETNAPSTIPANYAYAENNLWGQDIRHLYAKYEHRFSPQLNLNARVSLGEYLLNPASNFTIIQDAEMTSASPSYKYAYSGYISSSVQVNWDMSQNISWTGGVMYEPVRSFPKTKNLDNGPFRLDGELEDDMQDPPFDLVDPNGNVFGLVGLKDTVFGERNYYNFGGFLQAEIKAGEKLVITTGGRLDYNSIYKETINPRLGVVYRPLPKLSLKALYGTAYIQPSNYYRWENFANPFILHIPNQDIKPEKMQNISLSMTTFLTNNLSVRGEIFRNDLKDIIEAAIVTSETQNGYPFYNPYRTIMGWEPEVDWAEINSNVGEIYTQGFELDVNYHVRKLSVNVSYSYLDGKDKTQDSKLAKVSPHKFNANVDYAFSNFNIALSARYYSKVGTLRSNSVYGDNGDQSYEFDGAFVTYANLGYQIRNDLNLYVTVDNLLNKKHYGAAPYGESGWIQHRAPQALQKIFVGLTKKI